MTFTPAPGGPGIPQAIFPWASVGALGQYIPAMDAHGYNNTVAAWPAANRAIYMPIYLTGSYTMTQFFWANGNTFGSNVDMGVYAEDGTKLATTGSTAQVAVAFAMQTVSQTLTLGMGTYYIAMAVNNTTGNFYGTNSIAVNDLRLSSMAQEAAAFALPATITPAAIASTFLPFAGIRSL